MERREFEPGSHITMKIYGILTAITVPNAGVAIHHSLETPKNSGTSHAHPVLILVTECTPLDA